MPLKNGIRRAAWHNLIGVLWRLPIFYLAVLLFLALISLRSWRTSYALSPEWAAQVEGRGLEWSGVVGAAAKHLPPKLYPDKDQFYKEVLLRIQGHGDPPSGPKGPESERLKAYRTDLASKKKALEALQEETGPRDRAFTERIKDLNEANSKFDTAAREMKELRGRKAAPSEIKEKEASIQELEELRKGLRAEIKEISAERGNVENSFRKPLADLDDSIKKSEEGIKKAFDAALPSARPVDRWPAHWLPGFALHVGDEGDPYHIVYVILWYGIEGAITLLICIVMVPWLIRLGGGTSDPEAVKTTVTHRIKEWLAKAFGPETVESAAKAIAGVMVAGIAITGVSAAAGEQPPLREVLFAGTEGPQGAKGAPGEPGRPGDPGIETQGDPGKGEPGQPGKDGKNAQISQDWLEMLRRQADEIEAQARLLASLETKLETLSKDALETEKRLQTLTHHADRLAENARRMTTDVTLLAGDVSKVNASVDGAVFASQLAVSSASMTSDKMVQSLNRIQDTSWTMKSDVGEIKSKVDQAKDVPPTTVDLLRITTTPDGPLTRVNPFSHYEVNDGVINTVSRAMSGANGPAAQSIRGALLQMRNHKLRVYRFQKKLRECSGAYSNPEVRDLLQKLMPLILQVSRT